MADISMMTKSN